jgi:hypothetical protein
MCRVEKSTLYILIKKKCSSGSTPCCSVPVSTRKYTKNVLYGKSRTFLLHTKNLFPLCYAKMLFDTLPTYLDRS